MKENRGNCLNPMLFYLFFYMQVYDGLGINSRLIGTYCGTQTESFSSTRNSLTFQFSSDSSVSGKGFLLEWFAMDASVGPSPTIATGMFGNRGDFFVGLICVDQYFKWSYHNRSQIYK